MSPRRTEDEQRLRIINAAIASIEDVGLASCSMTMVAARAEITRAWLYNFFPDMESLLIAIWKSRHGELFRSALTPPAPGVSINDHLKNRIEFWMDLEFGAVAVGLFGLLGPSVESSRHSTLNEMIWEMLEETWIDPLSKSGLSRGEAVGATIMVYTSITAILLALHQSRLRDPEARKCIADIIDLHVEPSMILAD